MEFRDLRLSEKTLNALAKLGYAVPTEVQEKAIPEIIAGHNLLVRSQTGTGKTAAFGIGLIERIIAGSSTRALILTPTRELAVQVWKEIDSIGHDHGLRIHVVYGGQSISVQTDALRHGIDILVATPGRLLDLTRRGVLSIGDFNAMVLDEADQMLDMGFKDEVMEILNQLPRHKLMMLVSATIDESILSMAARYVPNSKTIEIGEIEVVSTITEEHVETTDREKFPRLLDVLRSHGKVKTLIFRETKKGAERLQERLCQRQVRCGLLQGDMSQARRNEVLNDFREGRINVLVATNVAARGLHIDNLGLIVNYDRAQSELIHLHRVGRTGRMGTEGKAINFVLRKESRDERMNEDHPDFAWMEGGLGVYRNEAPRRYGRPQHGVAPYARREPGHGHRTHAARPHESHGRPQPASHGRPHGGHATAGTQSHGSRPAPQHRRQSRSGHSV
jgi:ATP-dependent RNA helicase DeaD